MLWTAHREDSAALIIVVRYELPGMDKGKPPPALCAQQKIESQRRLGIRRIEINVCVCQFADVAFEQHHDRQSRRLLAFLDHLQYAVVRDDEANHGAYWVVILVRCLDGETGHVSRNKSLLVGLDLDPCALRGFPVYEPLSQRRAVLVPYRGDQHARYMARRLKPQFDRLAGLCFKLRAGHLGLALGQNNCEPTADRARDTHADRPVFGRALIDRREDNARRFHGRQGKSPIDPRWLCDLDRVLDVQLRLEDKASPAFVLAAERAHGFAGRVNDDPRNVSGLLRGRAGLEIHPVRQAGDEVTTLGVKSQVYGLQQDRYGLRGRLDHAAVLDYESQRALTARDPLGQLEARIAIAPGIDPRRALVHHLAVNPGDDGYRGAHRHAAFGALDV